MASGRRPPRGLEFKSSRRQERVRVWAEFEGGPRGAFTGARSRTALGSRAAAAPQPSRPPPISNDESRQRDGGARYHGCPSPIGHRMTLVRGVLKDGARQADRCPDEEKRLVLLVMVGIRSPMSFTSEGGRSG